MADLRSVSLLSPVSTPSTNYSPRYIVIGNSSDSPQNGGACCCWIYPAGVTSATFEMWGAGADGAGACCCAGPYQTAGSGQYSKISVALSGGYYNICSGSSGCCGTPLTSTCGFPSFVRNSSGTVVGCAGGGYSATSTCGHMGGQSCVGICVGSVMQGCTGLGTIQVPSITSADHQSSFCTNYSFQWLQGANKFQPNTRHSLDSCSMGMTRVGCCYFAGTVSSTYPGGGGATAQACAGGCCWGSWGAAGMVTITYG